MFGRNLGWDSSGESKDDKRSLDAIMARATFGTSRCESPGCDPDDNAGSIGKHFALFAFRITSKKLDDHGKPRTYENFCEGCENDDTNDTRNQTGCYMREAVIKGVLLCTCCTVAMVRILREDDRDWIVRPLSEDTRAIVKIVPRECKIQTISQMSRIGDGSLLASTLTAMGVDAEEFEELTNGLGETVGHASLDSIHAIPVTPELQDALERGDRAAIVRILTPIITKNITNDIARDMIFKTKKPLRKQRPITADEVLDLEDAQIENKTLEDLGFQMPDEHKDN